MKLYQNYKKQLLFVWLGILLLSPTVFSVAQQTAQDLKNQISQKSSDIAKLEQEIATYQTQLDTLGQQKNSLSNSIKGLDLTRKKLNADISITQTKIDKTNLTIKSLSSDIGNKENTIENSIDSISLGIRSTNEFEQSNILGTLLSQNDFTSVWNDLDNISTLRETIRQDIIQLKQVKNQLENTKAETITAKNELISLKSKLGDQQKIVIQNTNEKNALLKQTKSNEASYQKLLKDRIAKRDAFEKEIEDYEAQLTYILDPSKLPAGRVLSWPLEKVYVTQLFGKTVDSVRLYASGTHSGVDFKASVGTPIMSMADGTVMGTGDTDLVCAGGSFGKFVFIQYNNGLSSTFGHLSLIKVSSGQQVKRGEVVAYSGATGHVTGPHLHISLYAPQSAKMGTLTSAGCDHKQYTMPLAPKNAYLNAMDYLPPYVVNTTILNNKIAE